MKKNVIIDHGAIPYNLISECIVNSQYNVILLSQKIHIEPLRKLGVDNLLLEYDDFKILSENYHSNINNNKIYNEIVDDYNTLMIAERAKFRFGFQSNHNDLAKIDIMIDNFINLLEDLKPQFIIFNMCPHQLNTWIFSNVAEKLGIDVYYSQDTLIYGRSFIIKGVKNPEIINLNLQGKLDDYTRLYIEKLQKSYREAIPFYELERLKQRNFKIWSWKIELLSVIKRIKWLYFLPFKRVLYLDYKEKSVIPDFSKKYIIVFLHYQPERTSMPEGKYFANQWHLINTIHKALPEGYYLYVKEHPSMFTNTHSAFDIRYRDRDFYNNISKLSNTFLVDFSVDSFTLVDKCKCVATITGTVGGEALLRGKPVMVFGQASYRTHKYAFEINNSKDVQETIKKIEHLTKSEIQNYTNTVYIPFLLNNSLIGNLNEGDNKSSRIDKKDVRLGGFSKLFNLLLK